MFEQVMFDYSPLIVETWQKISVAPDPNIGWCVLKRRPRAYAPDETIFDEFSGVDTIPFQPWWGNMRRINPAGEMAWWLTYEAEKFNNDQDPNVREIDPTQPINIRSTGDGGNLKAFYKNTQTNSRIQIIAYDYRYPELATSDTFETAPHKIGLCSAINENGQIYKIAAGLEPLYFQVCRPSGLWVEKSKVIMLEQEPYEWTKNDVMKLWI